jgi:hypothetical protein
MAETITDTTSRLTTFISQNFTDVEVGPGSVINELLIKLAASIHNEQYNLIDALGQGRAIQSALSATTPTYFPIIDLVASNYNTARSQGSVVTGKIKITLSSVSSYSFRAGYTFLQPALNLKYVLVNDVRVSYTPQAGANETQLYQDQGFYYFIVDVKAEEAGPSYQVSSGAPFITSDANFMSNFVKAEAYGNFSAGAAVETDKELIAKVKSNLGNSRFESAAGIYNNFKNTFAGFQALSVCGANDAELVRAKQNLLGISSFGKADVYVRSSLGLATKLIAKTATKKADNTWKLTLDNSDAPGFYAVKAIIPKSAISLGGTLVFAQPKYGYALYADQRKNEINSAADARFTKYQTAEVTFTYSESPVLPVDSALPFEVHVTYQPNITEMQDLLLSDAQRLACADYLIRAAVPCEVSLNINLKKKRSTDTFDSLNLQQLKQDIFTYINGLKFGEELYASNIVDLCHNYDIKRVDLPITMTGVINCPDGSVLQLTDSDVLSIPNRLDKGVTAKTTLYFIDYYRLENGAAQPIDNIGLTLS